MSGSVSAVNTPNLYQPSFIEVPRAIITQPQQPPMLAGVSIILRTTFAPVKITYTTESERLSLLKILPSIPDVSRSIQPSIIFQQQPMRTINVQQTIIRTVYSQV